ncbi:MAG: ABC transporter ATP-binding protein [Alphaproteobacteria bacterium]|nr:MAG: ABC transporter ATP-binding protein [Alphaproteobacteria bacterium]
MNKKNLKNLELIKKINKDFLINQKSDIFICLILLLIVSLTTAIYPFLIQKVFDNFTENKYSWFFLPTIIALVASIRGIAMFFQIKQVSKVTLKVSIDIQKKLSNHLLFSDLDMIKKISSGNHISRIMNDVNLIRDSVERSLNNLIRDLITIIFLIVYLIWLDWVLAVVVLSIYPLALKPIISIGKKQRFYALSLQEKMESLTSFLSEIFRNISMIKSYSLEKLEKNRINKSLDSLFLSLFDIVKGRAKVLPLLEVLGGIAAAFVILIASYRINSGFMTIGSVIGFVTALLMLAQPARALGTFNTILQEGLSALQRIYKQLNEMPKIERISNVKKELKIPNNPTIEFKDVSFFYEKNKIILDKISFKTKKSKMHIIGTSGSGKSTIFNLISRFIDPKKGNIFINDVNIKDVSLFSLRQNISLVSQETMIYNDTFHNNISLGKLNATKREIIKAAKLANIHDFIISQENGYDTVIGEAGSNLSGGQKQRISIARAFLKNSKILLLDEVTSALDSKTSKNILKSINQLSKNKTCIYISHDDYEINKNSQKLIISNSKIK